MAANNNLVSRLNEFCQKNKLTLSFEKTEDDQMCLTICRQGHREYIQFFGKGRSLRQARCEAAKKAFEAGIIIELKKAAMAVASAAEASGSQMSDLVARVGRLAMGDGPDPVYHAYRMARDCKLRFFIDFGYIKRDTSPITLTVKIQLGEKKFKGKGENDLDAIYHAASQIEFSEFVGHKPEEDLSSEDDSSHNLSDLSYYQDIGKDLEYTCLTQLGPPQDPLFIFKCSLGDLVTYGLGRNKKSSKNKSAFRMLKMLGGVEAINSVKMETRKMEAAKLADVDRVREIVYSEMNAISALETLNKIRGHSLRFTETSKDIGVQVYFTTECRLMYGSDLKICDHEIRKEDTFEKDDVIYLRTTARSTAKKASKLEAAEKMLNLIRGEGAYTNEQAKMNRELAEYNKTTFNMQKDRIDVRRLSEKTTRYLGQMSSFAAEFLQDKPNYNPDYDYLAELQDMELAYRGDLTLEIQSSNKVYQLFNPESYSPFVSCIVKLEFTDGVVLSALGKSEREIEAKNMAAHELLKKLRDKAELFEESD